MQLYSGLVFRGLGLLAEIKSELLGALAASRVASLSDIVGVDAATITGEPWPDNNQARVLVPFASRTSSQIGMTSTAPSRK